MVISLCVCLSKGSGLQGLWSSVFNSWNRLVLDDLGILAATSLKMSIDSASSSSSYHNAEKEVRWLRGAASVCLSHEGYLPVQGTRDDVAKGFDDFSKS
jgi:hypothetical protein